MGRTAPWIALALLAPLVCGLDSQFVAARFAYGQWLADLVMIAYFAVMFWAAPKRLQNLMKYGVVIAAAGEALFSLVLNMYRYRLGNVPIYVPPGHAILYGAVFYFLRDPLVLRARNWLQPLLLAVSLGYAVLWFWLHQDLYGLLCTGLFVALVVFEPNSRLFFLSMFVLVGVVEQAGTRFGAWSWWPHAFDRFAWLPSGNPPSGIAVFYFAFDVLCLRAYLIRRPQVAARLARMRRRGRVVETPASAIP